MNEYMLSTEDNPYNPWTEYEKWYQWDVQHGYNLTSYLARIYDTLNPDPTDLSNSVAWGEAQLQIAEQNIYDNIILVRNPEVPDDNDPSVEGYLYPDYKTQA